ncbi:hypothetical protein QTP88_014953 [Uroleucon formosanum]
MTGYLPLKTFLNSTGLSVAQITAKSNKNFLELSDFLVKQKKPDSSKYVIFPILVVEFVSFLYG